MELEFHNKVAVISGGTSGIGLATAQRLIDLGADVVLLGRNQERGQTALNMLSGNNVSYISCDVASRSSCQKAICQVVKKYEQIDVLVNSAGIYEELRLEAMDEEAMNRLLNINVKGVMWLTQACLPYMGKGSVIVNVASDAGISGNYGCPVYCAAKGAVVALTKALALDMAPYTRVNCICPADVKTPLLDRQLEQANGSYTLEDMELEYPLERIGRPEEIAYAICAAASPNNSFMTGAIIPVDGGITAK